MFVQYFLKQRVLNQCTSISSDIKSLYTPLIFLINIVRIVIKEDMSNQLKREEINVDCVMKIIVLIWLLRIS